MVALVERRVGRVVKTPGIAAEREGMRATVLVQAQVWLSTAAAQVAVRGAAAGVFPGVVCRDEVGQGRLNMRRGGRRSEHAAWLLLHIRGPSRSHSCEGVGTAMLMRAWAWLSVAAAAQAVVQKRTLGHGWGRGVERQKGEGVVATMASGCVADWT
jgi:hypothetical protein